MAVAGQLTPEKCLDACHNAGYTYAGLEYSVVRIHILLFIRALIYRPLVQLSLLSPTLR